MVSPLAWSEAFEVGHVTLDGDHRRLVTAINDICAAAESTEPRARLQPLLEAFRLLAEDHFKREDVVLREAVDRAKDPHQERSLTADYLKAVSDTALDEHRGAHAMALKDLGSIIRSLGLGGAPAGSTICIDLKQWFVDHATKHDAHLKTIFQEA